MGDVYAEILASYSKILRGQLLDSVDNLLLLGICQALYRLFAVGNKEYFVLHASAALSPRGSCVVFGDDGVKTRGKTLCALEIATASGIFISDEYVLFRTSDKHVFGNGHIPINLKGEAENHFRKEHSLQFRNKKIIFADDYFKISSRVKVDFIIIPYLDANQTKLSIPVENKQVELYKATVFGHLAKLLNPHLDRTSILTRKDTEEKIDMRDALREFPDIKPPVPIYVAQLKRTCDINRLVEEIENERI